MQIDPNFTGFETKEMQREEPPNRLNALLGIAAFIKTKNSIPFVH